MLSTGIKALAARRILSYKAAAWGVGLAAVALPALRFALARFRAYSASQTPKMDTEFTGAYPRGSGAVNAVIGGHPEDMNGMPGSADFNQSTPPVQDGSDLSYLH